MGFDQYHEPPDELPAATRTFARLCASLTEEAEAIGWYEQRLAVETDAEAAAIMRDAQGEEFKHFSMDLEFLLRRTPLWRDIAHGILFQGGDIVEHGEAAEGSAVEGAADRGEPSGRHESLGIGRSGRWHREPSAARHAPITAPDGIGSTRGARAADTALAARKLIDFAGRRLAALGHEPGAHQRVAKPPAEGLTAVQRQVLPLAELRASFAVSRSELADADRGAEDIDLAALDAAARALAVGENTGVFHGWKGAGIAGIAQASPHDAVALGEDCERYPRHVAKAVEALLSAGIDGPYGIALGPDAYTRVLETSEHGGYPLLEHLREIAGGPLVWAPGVEGAVVSLRGGDFRSTRARTSRSATWRTTRTPSSSTWKRASASGW
jgi:uncharacterized linocin/CFP29 family protein